MSRDCDHSNGDKTNANRSKTNGENSISGIFGKISVNTVSGLADASNNYHRGWAIASRTKVAMMTRATLMVAMPATIIVYEQQ